VFFFLKMLQIPNYLSNFVSRNDKGMKQKKKELMMQEYGKYFLDLSKLIFGGVILAGVMDMGINFFVLFVTGGAFVALLAGIGFMFYSKSR